jgi:hypothetical protein
MRDIENYGRVEMSRDYETWLNKEDWVFEIKKKIKKTDTEEIRWFPHKIEDKINSTLALMPSGHQVNTRLMCKSQRSPLIRFGWGYSFKRKRANKHGEPLSLDEKGIKDFQKLYKSVQKIRSYESLDLPVRRLRSSAERPNDEDHLIDCVIGLERLLCADSSNLETTYRFKLRGAAILPSSYGSPQERLSLLGKVYNTRSNVVHGREKDKKTIHEYSVKAQNILKDIILWYMNEGAEIGSAREVVHKIDQRMVEAFNSDSAN